MIGFTCINLDKIDYFFERFLYANRDRIKTRGDHFCEFIDGTIVKKIYNIDNMSKYYYFDQFVIAGELVLGRIKEPYLRKIIRWSDKVPEEFRIVYWDNYAN